MRVEKPTWIELDTDLGTVLVCSQEHVATREGEVGFNHLQQYRPRTSSSDGQVSQAQVRISRRFSDGRTEVVGLFVLPDDVWLAVMKNFEVAQKEKRVAPKVRLRLETRVVVERPAGAPDNAPEIN